MTAAMVAGIQSICHFGKMQSPYLGELEFLFRRALGPNYRLARVTLTSESPSVDVLSRCRRSEIASPRVLQNEGYAVIRRSDTPPAIANHLATPKEQIICS